MIYDVVVMGAGLAGFSAALAAIEQGKKTIIVAKGLGNLYSASGYIDFLGYHPTISFQPVLNPTIALDALIAENPEHPYAKVGQKNIARAFQSFIKASHAMGLPYAGSLERNILLPTAVGALVPTTLYPQSSDKVLDESKEIVVVGIKELGDFYPAYVAENLEKQLGRPIQWIWVTLGLVAGRELNSYDLALTLEKPEVRSKLVKQIKDAGVSKKLVLIPGVLGVKGWQEVIEDLEKQLESEFMEIPTLPPSVMGYRLAESYQLYLRKKGVEFIIGYPVTYAQCNQGKCNEIGIFTANERLKKIKGANFCLATGGILGEGLEVLPKRIKERVFDLPVKGISDNYLDSFFNLEGQPLARAGVMVNNNLQPVNPDTQEVLLSNVFVAGATLAGFDPFVEKSGNGVALATGYQGGLLAAKGGKLDG